MPLVANAPGLWTVDQDLRILGARLGSRASILRLADGRLALHSAVPFTVEEAAAIDALGEVALIVAPNLFHHLSLAAAAARWPGAAVMGPPGLAEKVRGLPAMTLLPSSGAVAPGLEVVAVGGMSKVGEHVFFHRESGSLLITDLCFHFVDVDHWWTRTFMGLNQAYGLLTLSRLGRSMIDDKAALRKGVDAVLALPFERIGLCHGRPIEKDGRARLTEAFAWL